MYLVKLIEKLNPEIEKLGYQITDSNIEHTEINKNSWPVVSIFISSINEKNEYLLRFVDDIYYTRHFDDVGLEFVKNRLLNKLIQELKE